MSSELESEEAAHARARAEADGEGIKLCALMVPAFGWPGVTMLAAGERLDSAALTCGLLSVCATLLLVRTGCEKARTWRSQT